MRRRGTATAGRSGDRQAKRNPKKHGAPGESWGRFLFLRRAGAFAFSALGLGVIGNRSHAARPGPHAPTPTHTTPGARQRDADVDATPGPAHIGRTFPIYHFARAHFWAHFLSTTSELIRFFGRTFSQSIRRYNTTLLTRFSANANKGLRACGLRSRSRET